MEPRVARFLENATADQLKEKLDLMGHQTTGNKTTLKLRLAETIGTLTTEEINEHFPQNVILLEEDNSNSQQVVNEEEDLNSELESLRERVRKKQEIIELKKKLMELNEMDETSIARSCFNFRDIEESLTTFSGEDSYSVQRWIQQFEESAETLGWDQRTCFVYARRLLTGTAKLFLRTTSFKSWTELKQALIKEFSKKLTSAEVHNELRNRRKKTEETYQQYVFAMQEIASVSDVDEADVIHYIIHGINDSAVNKMLLYGANNMGELKSALKKYEKIKTQFNNNSHLKQKHYVEVKNRPTPRLKCFNCNNFGHVGKKCPQPKRDRGSCFRCGKIGHRISECSENPPVMSVNQSRYQNSVQQQCDEHIYQANNFEFNIKYIFAEVGSDLQTSFSCQLPTLLDSGSPISFIQRQYVPAYLVSNVDPDKHKFCGINDSSLQILGMTNVKIYFNSSYVILKLFVVKDCTMKYPVILGRNFIERSNLELRQKEINRLNKLQNENTANVENEHRSGNKLEGKTSCISAENSGTFSELLDDERNFINQILNIDINEIKFETHFKINEDLPYNLRERVENILKPAFLHGNSAEYSTPKSILKWKFN